MSSPSGTLEDLTARGRSLWNERIDRDGAAMLEGLVRPAIRLSHTEQETRSYLGGEALLPSEVAWPMWKQRPLSLVAVLDLEELAPFTTDVRLPTSGLLNFFYEADTQQAWGFDPSHRDGWRVVQTNRDIAVAMPAPEGAIEFSKIWLAAQQTLTIPGWEEPAVEILVPAHRPQPKSKLEELRTRQARDRDERKRQAYFGLLDAWDQLAGLTGGPHHQVGGWPRLQQNPIWKECDVVSRGLPLGNSKDWNDPRVAALPNTQSDWRLLLQLDTDDDAGWMWGDLGSLYYAIRDSLSDPDNFLNAWMVFQCG